MGSKVSASKSHESRKKRKEEIKHIYFFFAGSPALTFLTPRTFLERFLRSLRSLREAFSTLGARPERTRRWRGSNFFCSSSES